MVGLCRPAAGRAWWGSCRILIDRHNHCGSPEIVGVFLCRFRPPTTADYSIRNSWHLLGRNALRVSFATHIARIARGVGCFDSPGPSAGLTWQSARQPVGPRFTVTAPVWSVSSCRFARSHGTSGEDALSHQSRGLHATTLPCGSPFPYTIADVEQIGDWSGLRQIVVCDRALRGPVFTGPDLHREDPRRFESWKGFCKSSFQHGHFGLSMVEVRPPTLFAGVTNKVRKPYLFSLAAAARPPSSALMTSGSMWFVVNGLATCGVFPLNESNQF